MAEGGIEGSVSGHETTVGFEETFLPHLDAAYNLARWLTRNVQDAEDLVQEAYLRAFEHYDSFRGQSARAWLLTIVRNACYSHLRRTIPTAGATEFDERVHVLEHAPADDPESLVLREADRRQLTHALTELPEEFREAIVLRELEEMSYKEMAVVLGVPMGTVMSRLNRGRERLRAVLVAATARESH
jgi:RNA polymerase sigma factor (sigma-70 family)